MAEPRRLLLVCLAAFTVVACSPAAQIQSVQSPPPADPVDVASPVGAAPSAAPVGAASPAKPLAGADASMFSPLRAYLLSQGLPPAQVSGLLGNADLHFEAQLMARMLARPEQPRDYAQFLTPATIAPAQAFARRHARTLAAVEERTQCPPSVVVAILAIESGLGTYTGKWQAFKVLASRAVLETPPGPGPDGPALARPTSARRSPSPSSTRAPAQALGLGPPGAHGPDPAQPAAVGGLTLERQELPRRGPGHGRSCPPASRTGGPTATAWWTSHRPRTPCSAWATSCIPTAGGGASPARPRPRWPTPTTTASPTWTPCWNWPSAYNRAPEFCDRGMS